VNELNKMMCEQYGLQSKFTRSHTLFRFFGNNSVRQQFDDYISAVNAILAMRRNKWARN